MPHLHPVLQESIEKLYREIIETEVPKLKAENLAEGLSAEQSAILVHRFKEEIMKGLIEKTLKAAQNVRAARKKPL